MWAYVYQFFISYATYGTKTMTCHINPLALLYSGRAKILNMEMLKPDRVISHFAVVNACQKKREKKLLFAMEKLDRRKDLPATYNIIQVLFSCNVVPYNAHTPT